MVQKVTEVQQVLMDLKVIEGLQVLMVLKVMLVLRVIVVLKDHRVIHLKVQPERKVRLHKVQVVIKGQRFKDIEGFKVLADLMVQRDL